MFSLIIKAMLRFLRSWVAAPLRGAKACDKLKSAKIPCNVQEYKGVHIVSYSHCCALGNFTKIYKNGARCMTNDGHSLFYIRFKDEVGSANLPVIAITSIRKVSMFIK